MVMLILMVTNIVSYIRFLIQENETLLSFYRQNSLPSTNKSVCSYAKLKLVNYILRLIFVLTIHFFIEFKLLDVEYIQYIKSRNDCIFFLKF